MTPRLRVLIIVGYFDWFSGYQETVLARALAKVADVDVLASDRVAPIFQDTHLARLGVPRIYPAGQTVQEGIRVTRTKAKQWRGMVWSTDVRRHLASAEHDLVIQLMPGQLLPLAATIARHGTSRIAMYGDNSAMWANLSPVKQRLKWLAFRMTKGLLYLWVNREAERVYGYTPETTTRLAPFSRRPIELAPLAFDRATFFSDVALRRTGRGARGYGSEEVVVVAAGKPDPRKRLDLLVEGFALASRRDPRLRLLLVGTGADPHLADCVGRAGIEYVTRVEGFLSAAELNEAFNAADIGVWPRQPAITIQQSMASGLFVLLPKNDWVAHLLEPHTGRYVSPQATPREIADALHDAASSLGGASQRQARAEANQVFSGDSLAQRLIVGRAGVR